MAIEIRVLPPSEHPRAASFYNHVGYSTPIQAEDQVVVAEEGGELVGVVRLCREYGVLVLRGMQVAKEQQRRGTGTRMIRCLESLIGEEICNAVREARPPVTRLVGGHALLG